MSTVVVKEIVTEIVELKGEQLLIKEKQVEVVEVAKQGPQGIPGPSGSGIAGDVPVIVSDAEPTAETCLWLQTGLGDNGEDFTMWLKEPD